MPRYYLCTDEVYEILLIPKYIITITINIISLFVSVWTAHVKYFWR